MKSLMVFANKLLQDVGAMCQVDTARDFEEVTRRVEHEGYSFLTITLSDFGKSFEKSLDQGHIARNFFAPTWGFRNGVPKFLSGFLELVFDSQTGTLLDAPSISAILAVRQFSLAFGKIGLDCSDERIQRAKQKYIQCELEVRDSDRCLSASDQLDYERLARSLWSHSLTRIDKRLYDGDFRPKHGPGSTADRLLGNKKYDLWEWNERLETEFPFLEYARFSYSQFTDLDHVDFHEPGTELPVRVITVPKTLKTPRIIAMEPAHMQYVQQGILELMVEEFRVNDFTKNFICFDSQIPNQEMARSGSLDGSLATLDLSEASDRVSNQHVRMLLANHGSLFRAVDACRSRKADVDGKVVRLAKFASMGSALCFPMEAMVFATVVFLGIERSLGYQLSRNDIRSFFGRVRVYGDDIVVPVEHALSVKSTLELFGFKVNTDKSFWTGKFRESCGKDYFDGTDISIVKVRQLIPNNRRDVKELVSTVSLRNQLNLAGLFPLTVKWLDSWISSIIPFPKVLPESPVLGRHELDGSYDSQRVHPHWQIPLVTGVVVRTRIPFNSVDGYGALLKWYLKRGDDPFEDPKHLEHSGRPVDVDINYRWASPI